MNLENILEELKKCHKISIKEDYEKIQEPLLKLIVDISSNSTLEKTGKDYTRYDIIFINSSNKKETNIPKARVPEITLQYLISNNILSSSDFAFFEENNFERTFASSSGDLIKEYNQDIDKVQRYTEINCNGQKWYVCNQWDKTTIDKFNEYVNSKFSKYIKIVEH